MKKNLRRYKTGYGPMSKEIIDLLSQYSKHYQIMIVASLNQVDLHNSYVCNQQFLREKFKNTNALLCRDHCGPYFKRSDRHLILSKAIDQCKKTIENDIENGFDLIHIDVSRVKDYPLNVAEQLIEFAIGLKPNILIEFGSEENIGNYINEDIDSQINFCENYKGNIKFIVAQTGSLVKDKQIGSFHLEKIKILAEKIHSKGFLFKEHNGDYLNYDDLKLRSRAGIDAINVAPQLGVIQTQILYKLSNNSIHWQNFADYVYRGRLFEQWLLNNTNKLDAVLVSGHYFFKADLYKKLIESIDPLEFEIELKNNIFEVLDCYENRS